VSDGLTWAGLTWVGFAWVGLASIGLPWIGWAWAGLKIAGLAVGCARATPLPETAINPAKTIDRMQYLINRSRDMNCVSAIYDGQSWQFPRTRQLRNANFGCARNDCRAGSSSGARSVCAPYSVFPIPWRHSASQMNPRRPLQQPFGVPRNRRADRPRTPTILPR